MNARQRRANNGSATTTTTITVSPDAPVNGAAEDMINHNNTTGNGMTFTHNKKYKRRRRPNSVPSANTIIVVMMILFAGIMGASLYYIMSDGVDASTTGSTTTNTAAKHESEEGGQRDRRRQSEEEHHMQRHMQEMDNHRRERRDQETRKRKEIQEEINKRNHERGFSSLFHSISGLFQTTPSYHIPGAMDAVGDKSHSYAKLRKKYDAILPEDADRSRAAVDKLKKHKYIPKKDLALEYDVFDCPSEPPEGYPQQFNLMGLLDHWGVDDTKAPKQIHQGICYFDFQTEYDKAVTYRNMEVPFVVRNDPAVHAAAERWNYPGYMEALMGDVAHRTEYSQNNHFMYWTAPKKKKKRKQKQFKNWSPPTEMLRMPYKEWVSHANVTDDELLDPHHPHWYYRLISCGAMGDCDLDSSEYVYDELTFFQPRENLYLVEPDKQKGIHCRFGMKGVIAENHFDMTRNAIVVLGGERRYILSHPNQCENVALYPKGHPSARHSAVDWSNPDLETFPQFQDAESNEVVLQAGDVLYLPTNWFHFIVSLEMNFQCNTRSGVSDDYMEPIHECGF